MNEARVPLWPLHGYRRFVTVAPPFSKPAVLLITGPVGAGKTTTAMAIGTRLRQRAIAHAVIDLDALRQLWPAPLDDRFNLAVELENLRAVAGNYGRAGARRLVLAGVLENVEARHRYEAALEIPMTVCRLVVPAQELRRRLLARHPLGEERDWHLARSAELARVLSENKVGDVVMEIGTESLDRVADRVMSTIGW